MYNFNQIYIRFHNQSQLSFSAADINIIHSCIEPLIYLLVRNDDSAA